MWVKGRYKKRWNKEEPKAGRQKNEDRLALKKHAPVAANANKIHSSAAPFIGDEELWQMTSSYTEKNTRHSGGKKSVL